MKNVNTLKNNRILIIDDNPAIHQDIRKILGGPGEQNSELAALKVSLFDDAPPTSQAVEFEIDSAFQGEEGMLKVRAAVESGRPYAMAFVDVRMPPGWDGIETITRIWKEYPDLQVVICTAYSDYSWDEMIRKIGRSDSLVILKKPFDNIEALQLAHALTQKWVLGREVKCRLNDLLSEITQRKRVEAALQQTKGAAEAANRAKSQFLANMSHELRTPLNAIIGFSEVLADKAFGDLNDRQFKYANNILSSGRHLLQLINDILDLSKVEAGRLELARSSFSVAKALRDAQAIIKTLAYKKHINLEFAAATELPPLFADEAKFKQILYNLLSNAIKFTPEAGRVTVRATLQNDAGNGARRAPPLAPAGAYVRVAVSDTGIGIHPHDQERIFLEFEQVDSSYARQQQGTGLGLALTKKLVELHGGWIWVESEGVENKGSTFTFLLPLPKAAPQAPPAPIHTDPGTDVLHPLVLVLMKDLSNRRLIREHLAGAGYSVAIVSDADGLALALKAKRPYAVAIDDQIAQECDAQEMRVLRSRIPARIPAVIWSLDAKGRLGFSLFAGEWAARNPVRGRLMDAVRQSNKSTGPEVKTVLLIDDEPAWLELLAKTLVDKGFQVLPAASSAKGLELAKSYHPEVIILDLTMPECDGVQVVEQLRAHPGTKTIPILVHTGTALNEDERQRLAAQVYSISSKTHPESLLADLERWEQQPAETVGN